MNILQIKNAVMSSLLDIYIQYCINQFIIPWNIDQNHTKNGLIGLLVLGYYRLHP